MLNHPIAHLHNPPRQLTIDFPLLTPPPPQPPPPPPTHSQSGRYGEQKHRLLDCGLHTRMYIVEGLSLTAPSKFGGNVSAGRCLRYLLNPLIFLRLFVAVSIFSMYCC